MIFKRKSHSLETRLKKRKLVGNYSWKNIHKTFMEIDRFKLFNENKMAVLKNCFYAQTQRSFLGSSHLTNFFNNLPSFQGLPSFSIA